MSTRVTPLRIASLAGLVISFAALVAFLVLIGTQLYFWFRDGDWTHIGTSEGLQATLLHCCVSGDSTGHLADLSHWLDTPVDWLGLHRVLELVPASLTLFALSIFGNFIYIACGDRDDARAQPAAPSTA